MPDIELRPDDYKFKGKDGRWKVRDDRRVLLAGLLFALVLLGLIWWNREALSSGILFGVSAVFAASAGIFFALLTKDIY
jgi:hypothetical protein